jgi:nucleoside-diphosphate-sugar epimerase
MTQFVLRPDTPLLLTGATGLIGGEILRSLVRNGHRGPIWALVRAADARAAESRLCDRLVRSGDDGKLPSNVRPVPGDVTEPDWGLLPTDAAEIRDEVELIVHNAADTSFAVSRNTQKTNVTGARQLIDLADSCRGLRLVAYMSTASNVGHVAGCCVTESDGCRPDNTHFNDYTHSKAVAENVLRASGLPTLVLRPTIVLSGDLPDEKFARQILWCAPLARAFRALPLVARSRLDIVDVGHVVEMTLRLLAHPNREHGRYHISAGPDGAVVLEDMLASVSRFYGRKRPIHFIPPDEWTEAHTAKYVRTDYQRRVYRSLLHYFPFLNMDTVYDDSRLRRTLGPEYIAPRPVTDYFVDLLGRIPLKAALAEAALP